MLIVVLFVVVLSFFAGKWYSRRNSVMIRETPAQGTSPQAPTDDRAGIPPDSLHH